MASYGTLRSIQSLGIVYSCVSRGSTILALYASCQGNFSEVVPQVLSAIPVEEYGRCTYTSGDYMFHYVTDEGIIFLCITDDDFERSRAFLFLEEIKKKLFNGFGIEKLRYSSAYSLNTFFKEELKSQMVRLHFYL
jgi:vesicle-associated membrane protein 7